MPAGEAWYDQSGDTRRTRPPGPGIPPVSPLEPPPPGAAKIKRAEMRRQLRIAQQLKAGTLAIVAVLLLAAYPLYLFIRATAQDPVYGELDALNLPDWAAGMHDDNYQGNRWCIGQCRVRDRTWESQRAPVDTQRAYESALREGGWQIRSTGPCPAAHVGVASCWKRDEYVLDMWIRAPICNIPPPRPTISSSRTSTASPKPTSPATTGPAASCPGSLVTVKVFNAAGYYPLDWTESGVGGSPSPSPGGVPSATR